MDFQTAVKTCLTQKFMDFKGRAARSEFWWFVLAYVIGAVILSILKIYILMLLYGLAAFLPISAAGARRLQDMGRNGMLIFIPAGLSLFMQYLMPRPGMFNMQAIQSGDPAAIQEMMAQSGNWGLIGLLGIVQLVISLVFLWWLSRPSDPDTNAYGPPPQV